MPREIIHPPTYACTICKRQYPKWADALECERKGVKPHRFHKFQVVRYENSNGKYLAVVASPCGKDEKIDQHKEPRQYELRVDIARLNKSSAVPNVENGDYYAHLIFPESYRAKFCPLCSSKDVMIKNKWYFFNYSALSILYTTIKDVEHSSCEDCRTDFFTEPQLAAMLAKAAEAQAAENPTLV